MGRAKPGRTQKSGHFNPDVAVSQEEDRLDRAPLARNLADLIRSYDSEAALFVGVIGQWGSGKTSFLRMLEEALAPHEFLTVSWLRPWLAGSKTETLKSALAKIIESATGKGGLATQGVRVLRKFGAALLRSTTLSASASVAPGSPSAGVAVDVQRFMDELKASEADQLEVLKTKAAAHLAKSKRRIVLLVDDTDRLDGEEIRELLRILRAALDLPNIVFVVGGDERILARALDSANTPSDSAEALAKFLQVVVPLPAPTVDQLRRIALDNLETLRGRLHSYDADFSASEWDELKEDIDSYTIDLFRTPRDIVRWANSCVLPAMHLNGEINRADLCLLYAIRLMAPLAHAYLWDNRDLYLGLIGSGRKYYTEKNKGDRREKYITGFVGAVGQAHSDAENLLHRLTSQALRGYRQEVISQEQRIGSGEYFLLAFSLTLGTAGISDRTVKAIIHEAVSGRVDRAREFVQKAMTHENWFALSRSIARTCSETEVALAMAVCSTLMGAMESAAQWPEHQRTIQDGLSGMLRGCLEPFKDRNDYSNWMTQALLSSSLNLDERIRLAFDLLSDFDRTDKRIWSDWTNSDVGRKTFRRLLKQCEDALNVTERSDNHWKEKGVCLEWVALREGTAPATKIVLKWLQGNIVTIGEVLNFFSSTVRSSAQRAPFRVFGRRNYEGMRKILNTSEIAAYIDSAGIKPVDINRAMEAERKRRNVTHTEMVALFLAFERPEEPAAEAD